MGTRSLTLFFSSPLTKDEKGEEKPFVCMYRQFDGYLEGHGKDLAEFLSPRARINGIGGETAAEAANGIHCLAAQCVAWFKTQRNYKTGELDPAMRRVGDLKIGNVYLQEYSPDGWQEFEYEVRPDSDDSDESPFTQRKSRGWTLRAYAVRHSRGRKLIFEGTPKEFLKKLDAGEFEEKT